MIALGQVLIWINTFRKALVSAVGIATAILSMSVLPEQYALYVSTGIGIATAILTYVIPNVVEVIEELEDSRHEPIVGGISATQLIEEWEAQHGDAGPEPVAEAVEEPTPTDYPATQEFSVEEALDALGYDKAGAVA